jgi:hypothetical protein
MSETIIRKLKNGNFEIQIVGAGSFVMPFDGYVFSSGGKEYTVDRVLDEGGLVYEVEAHETNDPKLKKRR